MHSARFNADYVLPLRWTDDDRIAELTRYLRALSGWIDVIVVDGSPMVCFQRHAVAWGGLVTHVAPGTWPGGNGKVRGVMTGLQLATHERVVIADDDVRYDAALLARVISALDEAEVVRPQNYFIDRPWHARWDTARTLLNRALGSDYPGTLGVRRGVVLAAGGYDGDVLFENLELIRTVRAAGGRELRADDIFVPRVGPGVRHFLSQRVRQAYDDFAQPARLAVELSLLPLLAWAALKPRRLMLVSVLGCALAESGRRKGGGRAVWPWTSALWAPLWLGERAVCVWLAVLARATGGIRYGDAILRRAATPQRMLAIAQARIGKADHE
ncbi:glycosyltransferase [Glaciibacter sp. 2TAF33]|uniref:glycosyltransferase n=1 Tax=Glaciibacter sp. 2TAF33 TaxID=3233015 RepID=UPI003F8F6BAE